MTHLLRLIRHLGQLSCTLLTLLGDGVCYFMLRLRTPAALAMVCVGEEGGDNRGNE